MKNQVKFENKVLTILNRHLNRGRAEFYEGTLFIEDIGVATALTIHQKLSKLHSDIRLSGNSKNGFSYDFA